jgi:Cu2+-exporting ATPase
VDRHDSTQASPSVNPADPADQADHAGHSPDRAPTSDHSGHDRHAGHSVAMFRDKFWLSLALTIPVIFWSRDPQKWLGYAAPAFPGSDLIPAILGTVLFL